MINPKKIFSEYLNTRKLHPVALVDYNPVRILFNDHSASYDITGSHALISLKPFAIAVNAATIGFSVFYMLKENSELTLYVLAPLPILAIAIYYVNTIINKMTTTLQLL